MITHNLLHNNIRAMSNENCIDVKYVNNLSVAYLTRFFGSAGPVVKVEKNQNSKYVTIEFANRQAVEKALRFEGRVLDKDPIKIKVNKIRHGNGSQSASNSMSSQGMSLKRKENLINFKQTIKDSGIFKEEIWDIIICEFRKAQLDQNQKLITSMLIWRLCMLLMGGIKHFQRYHANLRGNYLLFKLQQEILERMEKKGGSFINLVTFRQSSFEFKDGRAWVWYHVPYPNTEEEQSKTESYSAQSKCTQQILHFSAIVGEIVKGLYTCNLIYNPAEANVQMIASLKYDLTSNREEQFTGIVENIGARDILYDILTYEQPNSCLTLSETCNCPENFECSLRLVGCSHVVMEEKGWCDYYEAVIWKRWTQNTEYYYHIQTKQQIEKLSFGDHNLIFEESQFSCERMCLEYRKYAHLHLSNNCKAFFIRKQPTQSTQVSFEKLYEDDVMNIYDEVEEPTKKRVEVNFHEEVVLNVLLVELRAQGHATLNQLKLEHYLLEYIEESINAKGLIVASQEMAMKLAANIIERERDGRLFEFAHSRFQKQIGEELWRLYCKQNERKIKNNLVNYQLGKK